MNQYTVVGLYPDSMWDGSMHDASFVEHAEAESPVKAAQEVRHQLAEETEMEPGDLVVLSVFEGHIQPCPLLQCGV